MEGMPFEGPTGERLRKALLVAVVLLAVFLAVEALSGILNMRYIGAGVAATNVITVSGHSEVLAVPDIATFTFSVVSDKATVAEAELDAAAKANALTAYLKAQGVDEKDVQTTGYSIEPQYEDEQSACPMVVTQGGAPPYCPPERQVLKGYEVRQSATVKVRDAKKAGDLLSGVGGKGATEVSGLAFTFDDPTALQGQARSKAIAEAKQKASALAEALGVSLVRIVSFNENQNGGGPMPYAYEAASGVSKGAAPAAPQISTGQNKVQDDVSISWEIR